MRKQCDICRGSRVIRLPIYRPLSVSAGPAFEAESIEASSREYPCPECGHKVDMDRVAVLDVHSRIDLRYEDQPFEQHIRDHLAHLLVDHLLRGDYITFEKGEPDTHSVSRAIVASLGVVSKSQIATFEQRLALRQDQLARVAAEEAIKQIDNWGSHYGRTGIAKDDAAKFIRDAVKRISENWSKAMAVTRDLGNGQKNEERAKLAYDTFRGGFRNNPCPVPHWNDAPAWIRDVVVVAYLQGTLDGMTTVISTA
jgi:hypothetical protein